MEIGNGFDSHTWGYHPSTAGVSLFPVLPPSPLAPWTLPICWLVYVGIPETRSLRFLSSISPLFILALLLLSRWWLFPYALIHNKILSELTFAHPLLSDGSFIKPQTSFLLLLA